jgi:predicted nucleic acid-binding protein
LIYVDSSVVLARILMEDRRPAETLWQERLSSSFLLQYEVWNRIHARRLGQSHAPEVDAILARIGLTAMTEAVLARALEPWPIPVRTLDALHLATIEFLRGQGEAMELATYDIHLIAAAQALEIPLREL